MSDFAHGGGLKKHVKSRLFLQRTHTERHPQITTHFTALSHELERLLPLSGVRSLVVIVEATRGGDVFAPSLVRCPVASFASSVAANMTLHFVAYRTIFCVLSVFFHPGYDGGQYINHQIGW